MEENNEIKENEGVNTIEENITDNNKNSKSNKKVIYIILGIAAFLSICLIVSCIYYSSLTNNNSNNATNTEKADTTSKKDEKENNTSTSEQVKTDSQNSDTNSTSNEPNTVTLNFNFDKMVSDINNSFNSGSNPYLIKCTMINQETLETSNDITKISQESFNVIINKLKSANSYDETTSSFFGCPPRYVYYAISLNENELAYNRSFSIGYGLNDNDLLVGYNDHGYAFHFNNKSDIDNFIESLK